MADLQALDNKLHWYKDAVIYELHIKAFYDSNEDGIGDFNGLMEKLDYLEDLGVTTIWLLPFYPSPLKDDGYDIADYYSINSSYGDINELQKLLEEAHRRNLKVITELVLTILPISTSGFKEQEPLPGVQRKEITMYGVMTPRSIKMCELFSRILKAATGHGMTWHNNTIGIASFIISLILIMTTQRSRTKFLK
jgi:hypothetical protein